MCKSRSGSFQNSKFRIVRSYALNMKKYHTEIDAILHGSFTPFHDPMRCMSFSLCVFLPLHRYSVGCSKRSSGQNPGGKEQRPDKVRKRPRTESNGNKHWNRQEDGGRVTTGPLKRDSNMQVQAH